MSTKYILEKIKVEGVLSDLITKSNGENVAVTYNDSQTTLAAALASIYTSISSLPTGANVDSKISTAISGLINGAPETYDTLKEIADYISSNQTAMDTLNAAIGNKVSKEEGKGLSAEDFTTALKTKLENLPERTVVATTSANGFMSAADKTRLDAIRGVRYGSEAPADMLDGELFVRVVSDSE